MTDDTLVSYRVEAGIATIELDDPDRGNALSLRLARDLAEAAERASRDPETKVILLQAVGRNFCVGGDVFEMHAAEDRGAHLAQLTEAAHRAVRTLVECGKPVVAAVQGAAAGGAIGLALAADLTIVDEGARFVFAYPAIGATPDCGTSWLLPRAIGTARALAFAMTDRPIGAPEAVACGLAGELAPAGTAQARAREVAEEMGSGAPGALGVARSLLRGSWGDGFAEHLERESRAMVEAVRSDRSRELLDAFVDRARRPRA